jgi:hypothetical protein
MNWENIGDFDLKFIQPFMHKMIMTLVYMKIANILPKMVKIKNSDHNIDPNLVSAFFRRLLEVASDQVLVSSCFSFLKKISFQLSSQHAD